MSDAYRSERRAKRQYLYGPNLGPMWSGDEPNDSVFDPEDMLREGAAIEISRDPELMAEAMRETATKGMLMRYARANMHGTKYERAAARDAIAESYVDTYLQQQQVSS